MCNVNMYACYMYAYVELAVASITYLQRALQRAHVCLCIYIYIYVHIYIICLCILTYIYIYTYTYIYICMYV